MTDKHVVTAAHCVHYHKPHELFVGVGDWDKDVQDYGEILTAVVNVDVHPTYKYLKKNNIYRKILTFFFTVL